MKTTIAIGSSLLIVGIFCTTWIFSDSKLVAEENLAPIIGQSTGLSTENNDFENGMSVETLARQLDQERQAREVVETKITALSEQVAQLKLQIENIGTQVTKSTEQEVKISAIDPSDLPDQQNRNQTLATYGFTPERIDQIRSIADQQEMAELYLRGKAQRENWANTERFNQELRELQKNAKTLRDELSEQEYNRYLYSMGRPNRISVSRVMEGSPAAKAGIRNGDRIHSYDSSRIYTWREMRQATSQGQAGNTVGVELERKGQIINVYIPRGPLGIQMNTETVEPSIP